MVMEESDAYKVAVLFVQSSENGEEKTAYMW